MVDQPHPPPEPFRFRLRSLLVLMTCLSIAGSFIWFVPLLLLMLFIALAVQCAVFVVIQRLAQRLGGSSTVDDGGPLDA